MSLTFHPRLEELSDRVPPSVTPIELPDTTHFRSEMAHVLTLDDSTIKAVREKADHGKDHHEKVALETNHEMEEMLWEGEREAEKKLEEMHKEMAHPHGAHVEHGHTIHTQHGEHPHEEHGHGTHGKHEAHDEHEEGAEPTEEERAEMEMLDEFFSHDVVGHEEHGTHAVHAENEGHEEPHLNHHAVDHSQEHPLREQPFSEEKLAGEYVPHGVFLTQEQLHHPQGQAWQEPRREVSIPETIEESALLTGIAYVGDVRLNQEVDDERKRRLTM